MQNTKRILLKNGIGLTCVQTMQSKTACLSAMFARPLGAKDRSLSALLPYVLRSSCRDYAGQQAVASRLDELYGARLEAIVRKRGEVQLVGFAADVIDESYAMQGGEGLFAETAQLMASMLLHPAAFEADVVSREAEQLCARIAALPDDKRVWAIRRMFQHMCADEAYSAVEFGDMEQLRTVTPEQLIQHYQYIVGHAPLELFYCGSLEPETAAQQLEAAMHEYTAPTNPVRPTSALPRTVDTLRTVTEEEPVKQGKLTIGMRTGITVFDADYPALTVLNACYGGSTSSRLFCTVREKLSLCYYASTQTDKLKGVLTVTSGIENESEPQARAEILRQLTDMQNGGLTEDEVTAAKRFVCASLRSCLDSPLTLENYYQTLAAAGITEPLETLIERIERVTCEEVTAAARKLVPDTVYFLKGAAR